MSIILNRLRYVLSPQFDIYEQIAEVTGGRVADIGCGTGFGSHLLARKSERTFAYEIDSEMIAFAKRAFTYKNMTFHYGNITEGIPGQFDCVTMIDVIEHIEQDELAITNVSRMLKDGGTFFCSTPNRLSRYRMSDNHVREYSPAEFEALLSATFADVSICSYGLEQIQSDYQNPLIGVCKESD